uniref:Uncharacterized protein n=1 Tax=Myoviridae sp. ctwwN25 TaxID=2825209 RepID=A0A8S5PPH7_9CAUD|nr:MAG TPA: hypothetical protein [Myoviridae sp. ctwwN25]
MLCTIVEEICWISVRTLVGARPTSNTRLI